MAVTALRANFVLLGDSITEQSLSPDSGWGALLAARYARRADVLNRGFSGYNTRWALEAMPYVFGPAALAGGGPPALVIVFFGANDASLPTLNKRQYVPLDEFSSNLREIVARIRKLGVGGGPPPRVVLIGAPPVGHQQRLAFQIKKFGAKKATGKLERTLENAGVYSSAAAEVAKELGCPMVDLWTGMQAARPDGSWTEFLSDGLHLSPVGQRFTGEALIRTIEAAWPELAITPCTITDSYVNSGSKCAGLPLELPPHDKIDDKEPHATFDRSLGPALLSGSQAPASASSPAELNELQHLMQENRLLKNALAEIGRQQQLQKLPEGFDPRHEPLPLRASTAETQQQAGWLMHGRLLAAAVGALVIAQVAWRRG